MRRFPFRFLVPLVVGIGWIHACLAASDLIFPRINFDNSRYTGFAIANPGKGKATVTLTAYGLDGRPLQGSGVQNPRVIEVDSGKQYAALDATIFNGYSSNPGFKGWVRAQSNADNLTGFFLMGDPAGQILDGADLPARALDLYFNLLLSPPKYQPEISVVNPNGSAAQVSLTLVNYSGTPGQPKSVSLPANGAIQAPLETWFASEEISQAAYLRVKSDQPVAGFEFVFARDGSDMVGLTAQPTVRKFSSLNFPHIAVLGDWSTQVGVFNLGDELALVSITAYRPDGTLYAAPEVGGSNPFRVALAPRGAFTADVETLFNFRPDSTKSGWLKVDTARQTIHGFVAYGTKPKPTLAAVAAQADPQGTTTAVFSHQANGGGFYTGLAILNAGSKAVNLEITSLSANGQVLGSVKRVLAPLERIADLVSQFAPQAAGVGGGLVVVRSSDPVFTTELFGTLNSSSLANVPSQAGPPDYNPNPTSARFLVEPDLAPVELKARQIFKAKINNAPASDLQWSVNGKPGGNDEVGRIDNQGNYTAPTKLPLQSRVTIRASTPDGVQVAGATVDLVQKQAFQVDVNFLRSQTYLSGLKKLYVAELSGLGAKSSSGLPVPRAGAVNTVLSEVGTNGQKKAVRTYLNTNVLSVISFTDSKGAEYLLLSTYDSGQPLTANTGQILRFNPTDGQSAKVASELKQPVAMTIDDISGDLVVADAGTNSIVTIAKAKIDPTIRAKSGRSLSLNPRFLFVAEKPGGLLADRCTGAIYTSETAKGRILRFDRKTKSLLTLVSGLQQPGRLFGIFRSGLDCPEAFFILVAEEPTSGSNGKLTLVIPSEKDTDTGEALKLTLLEDLDSIPDISSIPRANPYLPQGEEAILFGDEVANGPDHIFFIPTEDDYEEQKPDKTAGSFDSFTVGGFVLQDGDGVGGITLTLADNKTGQVVATTSTDIFGFYSFEDVPIGSYTLTPSANTHIFTPASRPVSVVDSEVTVPDFDAEPKGGFTISGKITDSGGRPIFDAGVVIIDENLNELLVFSLSDGAFRRRGLPNGRYGLGVFYSDLVFVPDVALVTINGANQTVNFLATTRVWTVSGKITPRDGKLPGEAALLLYDTISDQDYYAFGDASGNFQFLSIPERSEPNRYQLFAGQNGFEFKVAGNGPSSFSVTSDLAVNLESTFVGYDIPGLVLGFDQKPIPGVTISYGNTSVTTDAAGQFTLSKVKSNGRVSASKPGFTFFPAYVDIDLTRKVPDLLVLVGQAAPPATPTIQSMGPSVSPGVPVTITGTNFTSDVSQLQVSFGSTVAPIISATQTQIRAWVPLSLPAGPIDVTVAGSGRSSVPFSYTVLRQIPIITSVTPRAISDGQTVDFVIRGENFLGAKPLLGITPNTGLTLVGGEVTSSAELHITYRASQGLAPGLRDLNVYFDDLQSNFFELAVNPGGGVAPTLTSVTPSVVKPGTRATFIVSGSGFLAGGKVFIIVDTDTGFTFVDASINNDGSLTARYDIAPDAVLGKRHFQVAVGGNISNMIEFVVSP